MNGKAFEFIKWLEKLVWKLLFGDKLGLGSLGITGDGARDLHLIRPPKRENFIYKILLFSSYLSTENSSLLVS